MAIALLAGTVRAQSPDYVTMVKIDGDMQMGENAFEPYQASFLIDVAFPSSFSPASVQLHWPDGTWSDLPDHEGNSFSGMASFDTPAERNAAFPDGEYRLWTNNNGSLAAIVTMPGGAQPAVRVANWAALQSLKTLPAYIRWDPIPGAAPDDYIQLTVETESGRTLVNASSMAGTLSATNSFEYRLPDNLPAGEDIYGALTYMRVQYAMATNGYTDVATGRSKVLFFTLRYDPSPATITQAPLPQSVGVGQKTILTVEAGGGELTYQWLHDGKTISGATRASYEIAAAQAADAGSYQVQITNASGTITTTPVLVTVAAALRVSSLFESAYGSPVDGPAYTGRFASVRALIAGESETLYIVGDTAIRVLAPDGTLSTLAGSLSESGYVDDAGTAARFSRLAGGVRFIDQLYVADSDNNVVRRVSATGKVTTLHERLADDTWQIATFPNARDVTVDEKGNLWVLTSHAIRKVSPDGANTPVAGNEAVTVSVDGTGAAAGFANALRFTLTPDGSLYVIEPDRLRRVSATGEVTTLYRSTSETRSGWEGQLPTVAFGALADIASDANGILYVSDGLSIRRITPGGWVNVLAGKSWSGNDAGLGAEASFTQAGALALMSDGSFRIGTYPDFRAAVRKGILEPGAPAPSAATVATTRRLPVGSTIVLTAPTPGLEEDYQWFREGQLLPGATARVFVVDEAQIEDAGRYSVRVNNRAGSAELAVAVIDVDPTMMPSRIVNLSIRTNADSGDKTLIAGFVVGGGSGKLPLLLRGSGPALAAQGVVDYLRDPSIVLFDRNGVALAANDNWGGDPDIIATGERVGAFKVSANGSRDAALLQSVTAAPHTLQVRSMDGSTGIVLLEVYDAEDASQRTGGPRLVNVSARAEVQTGDGVLIAGFVVAGDASKTVLIRGVGPSLTGMGVSGALADPMLEVYSGGQVIATNDNWGGNPQIETAANRVGAFSLVSATSKDATLLLTLEPGVYTALVRGVNKTTGVGLVEIYEVE